MMDEQGTRFTVLLEDLQGQVKAVAESNQAVAAALADMRADFSHRFEQLDVRLVGMSIEMRELKGEVGQLGGKVDKLEGRFDKLEGRFDTLEGRFDTLEGKVDKLEGKVDTLGGKVDKLEAFASDAGPRLVRVEGKVDTLEAFATDAGPRLVRIETHLALPALSPRKATTRPGPSKPHRKKPAKRN
jgi:predicted nuclease with TOPRIM domain